MKGIVCCTTVYRCNSLSSQLVPWMTTFWWWRSFFTSFMFPPFRPDLLVSNASCGGSADVLLRHCLMFLKSWAKAVQNVFLTITLNCLILCIYTHTSQMPEHRSNVNLMMCPLAGRCPRTAAVRPLGAICWLSPTNTKSLPTTAAYCKNTTTRATSGVRRLYWYGDKSTVTPAL